MFDIFIYKDVRLANGGSGLLERRERTYVEILFVLRLIVGCVYFCLVSLIYCSFAQLKLDLH